MLPIINLPVKIVRLFTSNVSPNEIASGVCLGMFMGFIPLNGPMAVFLLCIFFIFKINRLAAMLVLPLFKLFYILGISTLTEWFGGVLLIDSTALKPFWSVITHMPILALLDFNNTLVAGGFALSAILCIVIFPFSAKGVIVLRTKYFDKIKNTKFVKWFLKLPIIVKILSLTGKTE
ncbi:MAG: TIGR03546 family protein [Candidatus Omnitrophica bacterium]|nr:TIGR03546 family protein [Candidatus Omnitrophota bacterium]